MKKGLSSILGLILVLFSGLTFVSAVTETSNLHCGNNICEKYSHVFTNIGDINRVTVEDKNINIKLLTKSTSNSVATWDVNDVPGEMSTIWNNYFHPDRGNFDYAVRLEAYTKYNVYDYAGEEAYLKEEQYCEQDCIEDNQTDNWILQRNIQPGWNLLSLKSDLPNCNMVRPEIICKDDILAQFVYIPSLKKYINMRTAEKEYSPEQIQNIQKEITGQTSAFTYFKDEVKGKKSTTIYFKSQVQEFNGFNLTTGWNFITITQDMYLGNWNPEFGNEGEYFSFDSIKGNCNYEKIVIWNPKKQDWLVLDSLTPWKSYDFDEILNLGAVVKVSSDCKLGTSTEIVAPPTIPNEISSNGDVCVDGGDDFYVKNNVTISKQNGEVYTDLDLCLEDGRVQEQLCLDSEDYPGSKNFGSKYLQCPNGCSDGACI